jgi:hypothetical protein
MGVKRQIIRFFFALFLGFSGGRKTGPSILLADGLIWQRKRNQTIPEHLMSGKGFFHSHPYGTISVGAGRIEHCIKIS